MPASRRLVVALCALHATLAVAPAARASNGTGGASADALIEAASAGAAASSDTVATAAAAPEEQIVAADVPYGPLIAVTARRHGIPVALFTALVWHESGFNPKARSKAGARGLTQLMPATARELGVRKIYDPAQNLDGGARYLRAQLLRFRRVDWALAAYNAGPGAVRKHKGIPPYKETRRYVKRILELTETLTQAGVR